MSFEKKITEFGETLERLKDNDEINEHNYMTLYNDIRDINDVFQEQRFLTLYCLYSNVYISDSDDTICTSVANKKCITLKVEIDPSISVIGGIEHSLVSTTIPEHSVSFIENALVNSGNNFALTFKTGISEYHTIYKMEKFY